LLDAATKGWLEDPVFKPFFHNTGYIVAADSPAAISHLLKRELISEKADYIPLTTAEDFQKTMPPGVLTGDFPGWQGWYKKTGAGWVHARKSIESACRKVEELGIKLVTGSPQGEVRNLIVENGDVCGAKTADGKEHRGIRTILAAGAASNELFDFKHQLRPTAWTLAHIKMTSEEAKLYKDLPVLFNIEKGFFMEPDEDKQELKICDEHPGYCNWVTSPNGDVQSIPFAKHQIPKEAEDRVRSFLAETMPHLQHRPFSFARICWCADTADRSFLIDYHPEHASLLLATGGSGHGFMHIPSIGGFVADAMEGKLDEKLANAFKWRPETAINRDWQDTQGRFGGPNVVMDLQKVDSWTTIGA
jgi:sarcosine oxidase / L-pipecolate oxidase